MTNKILTATNLSKEIRDIVEKIAKTQGITVSEYLRKLVIDDLEKRNIITSKVKNSEVLKND